MVFNGGSLGENLVEVLPDETPMKLHVQPSVMPIIYTKDSNHAAVFPSKILPIKSLGIQRVPTGKVGLKWV